MNYAKHDGLALKVLYRIGTNYPKIGLPDWPRDHDRLEDAIAMRDRILEAARKDKLSWSVHVRVTMVSISETEVEILERVLVEEYKVR